MILWFFAYLTGLDVHLLQLESNVGNIMAL